MGRSIDFIEFRSQVPTPEVPSYGFIDSNDGKRSRELTLVEEHPLMSTIRAGVTKYRVQSAAHFDLSINVKQAFRLHEKDLTSQSRINVIFGDFFGPETRICRPVFRKHSRRKHVHVFAKKAEVWERSRFVPLNHFLAKRFPCFPDAMGNTEMQTWWGANGKKFKWLGLPTELKERVISFCIHQPLKQSDKYRRKLNHYRNRFVASTDRDLGVYEIVDKLTDWAALLGVSHQVRTIVLRLCFVGSSSMTQGKGFSIDASSCHGLDKTLQRLGRYHCMIDVDSLPVDDKTQMLANCYRQYPRVYKDLQQYATFRHGIRRINFGMTFFDYMHFFKTTVGGFGAYLDPETISYEVFDQLPHLHEIVIKLPGRPRRGWSNIRCPGPLLFHHDSPCPRTLHRVIYERALEVLTMYSSIKVYGFVDEDEQARYNKLRDATLEEAAWTVAEYEELYTDCGGGIELEEVVQQGDWSAGADEEQVEPVGTGEQVVPMIEEEATDDFFPPKCYCAEKCHLLVN